MYNGKIAGLFEEIANMLELSEGDHRFEVLAYRKAAVTVGTLQEDIEEIYNREGTKGLMELPGIGKTIADRIKEFLETGRIEKYDRLKKEFPIDFNNLTKIPGLGAKRVFRLYKELRVKDIESLKEALEKHKIKELEGFGERSESEILKGMQQFISSKGRMLLGLALPEAEAIAKKLKESGLVKRVEIAGSTRRMKETVGDFDILVTAEKNSKVTEFIPKLKEVESVVLKGPTKITVRLKIGLNCDVRIVEDRSFGAALQYFTGNKDHNVKLRQIAIRKGYKLNEYGLFNRKNQNVCKGGEEELYEKLGVQYMAPEMREDRGEIELGLEHKIPKIVEIDQMKGDLHVHTNKSDGSNTLEEMADAARKLGRKYIGITDHSKSEYVAGGMTDKQFEKHFSDIDSLGKKLDEITLLKSSEIDILKDGSLDLEKKTLDMMDYRLATVHTNRNMPKDEMTKRIIKAFESGYVNIWAHPTGRLIQEREPISMDLDKIFQSAKDNNVVMEVDGSPERLDLSDENIIRAREYKLKFAVDTDAHRTNHLLYMRYGVATARRGWLSKEEVINTMNLKELLSIFKK